MDQDSEEDWLNYGSEEDEKDLETPKLCIDDSIEYQERVPPPRKPYKSAFEIIQERNRNRKQQQQDAKIPSSVKMSNHEIKSPYAFLPATRPLLSCGIRFDYNSNLISNKQQEYVQESQDLHCEPLKDAFRHLGVITASRAFQIERELVFEPTAEEIKIAQILSTQQQQHHKLAEETEGSTKVVDKRRAPKESLEKELNDSLQLLSQKLDTSASGAQLIDHVLDCSFRKKEDGDIDDEISKMSTQQLENAYLVLANDRTAQEEKSQSCNEQEQSMSSVAKNSSPIASTTATTNHLAAFEYSGFSLATGKSLPVDQGVVSKIQRQFERAEKKMKLTEVTETSCNLGNIIKDTTMQSPLTASTPIVTHGLPKGPRSIFHQPVKDDDADPPDTQIDLDYVDKLERDYRATLAEKENEALTIVEQENTGFAFASGKKVSLNQSAVSNIKQQFDRAEKDMKLKVAETSCNLGDTTMQPPLTASTPIVTHGLPKGPRSIFHQPVKDDDADPPDTQIDLDYVDKLERDYRATLAEAEKVASTIVEQENTGFAFASGKKVSLNQSTVSNIKQTFDQAEKKMKLTEVIETSCNLGDTTMQSPLKSSTPVVTHGSRKGPRNVFHQPAKDDDADPPDTQIDLDYVDKLERDYRATLAEAEKEALTIVEQENTGFAFASGKKVSLNQSAVSNIKQQFDRAEKDMKLKVAETSWNLGDTTMQPPLTASTPIVTHGLPKGPRSIFHQPVKDDDADPPDTQIDLDYVDKLERDYRATLAEKENEALTIVEQENTGFAFASGKKVSLNQSAVSNIKQQFDRAEKDMKLNVAEDSSCTLEQSIASTSAAPARGLKRSLENETTQQNIGFELASGKNVSVNHGVVSKIQRQFEQAEKKMKLTEVIATPCDLGDTTMQSPKTPLTTSTPIVAHGSRKGPRTIFHQPAKDDNDICPPPDTQIDLDYVDKLERDYRATLAEAEKEALTIAQQQNTGFAFASGKKVSLNQDAVSNIKQQFDRAEKDMKLKVAEDSSCNLGHGIASTPTTSLATPARGLKRSLKNETTPQNIGFALASGKNVSVDQEVVSKIRQKFDQAEKKMKLTEVIETSCNLGDTTMQPPLTASTLIVAHGSRKGQKNIVHQPAKDDNADPPDTQIDLDYVDKLERDYRATLAEKENVKFGPTEQQSLEVKRPMKDGVNNSSSSHIKAKSVVTRDTEQPSSTQLSLPKSGNWKSKFSQIGRSSHNLSGDSPATQTKASSSVDKISTTSPTSSTASRKEQQAEKRNSSGSLLLQQKGEKNFSYSGRYKKLIQSTNEPVSKRKRESKLSQIGRSSHNLSGDSSATESKASSSVEKISTTSPTSSTASRKEQQAEKRNSSGSLLLQQKGGKNISYSGRYKKLIQSTNEPVSKRKRESKLSQIGRSSHNLSGDSSATESKASSSVEKISTTSPTSSTASRKEQQAEKRNSSGSLLLQQKGEKNISYSGRYQKLIQSTNEPVSKRRCESVKKKSDIQTPKVQSNKSPPSRSHYESKREELSTLLDDLPGKNVKKPEIKVPRKQTFADVCRNFHYTGKIPNFNIEPTNEDLYRACVQAEQLENTCFPRRLKWKEQCEYVQNKPALDCRPVAGRLFTAKKTENRAKLKDYNSSRVLSLKKSATKDLIPFERILHHSFDVSDLCNDDAQAKGFLTIVDDAELVLDRKGSLNVGFEDIKNCFRAMRGVDPRLVSDAWMQNAYEMIFWKLMIMEAYLDGIDKHEALNIENILLQLKYRYDREIDRNERPVLRKIVEGDEAPGRRIVLKVMRTTYSQQNGYVLELTDGWYRVLANVDACLAEATAQGKICAHRKLLIANMECLASAESKGILEHPSLPRVKLHGNSTRRVNWATKMGCCRFPQPFQTALGSVKADGGGIGQLRLIITHVYSPIYIEFDGDRKEFRSEKMQNRINDQNETNLCAMYERIRSKVLADEREELRKKYIGHKRTFKTMGGGLDLTEISEILAYECESTLAQTAASYLTDYNRKKLNELHAQHRYELDEKIKRLMKLEDKSKVTQLLKFRVADANDPKSSSLVSWWHPPEELFDIVKEGRMILLYRARAERAQGNMIISARENAVIREVKVKPDLTKFKAHFRRHTKLGDINENFAPQHDEFDIACVVLHIGEAQPQGKFSSQDVFVVDEEMNFVCVKFHINIAEYAYDDVLKEEKVLYIRNLQWRRSFRNLNTEMPEAYAVTDTTTFVTSSRRESERTRLIELEQAIAKRPNFFEECKNKLVKLIGPVDFRNMQNRGIRKIPKLIKTPPPKSGPAYRFRFEA